MDTTLWSSGGTFSLIDDYKSSGQKYYTLAFITSDSNGDPSWGGYSVYGMNSDHYEDKIDEIRSVGRDVIISFGGASDT